MKKVLIIFCIVIVALSSVVSVNQWINVSDNDSKNFTIRFDSKLSSEFNKVVDTETKKVIKIKEFNISPISIPTPQNSLWAPKLRLYLNNDKEEFVHEFVQGEKIRIFLENIGNETITLPNPAPWEVIVLPMIDAEIESKLHCSPEESVYAKFPKIYPDMYNISNAHTYKPKVEQTAVLIHPNETLTWTWDQRLDDGSLLKPGHYQVVLKGLDVECVEQTIFYVLPKR
ncbi:MAG: membrane or secreted protein [Candidatus Syntrophoarchaeum caldarius]|uniref:Membrane or secreted protein n=1 Tax=Candidatus Syntropharchaeum caldarium TaxID=1838285 RepID=A0A1F2P8P3_9EURY|nr:MAG: membrane or secreted protein [Candidatus Syntrophoarchaeum caldarius]